MVATLPLTRSEGVTVQPFAIACAMAVAFAATSATRSMIGAAPLAISVAAPTPRPAPSVSSAAVAAASLCADASAKKANTIAASNRLRKTYNPVNIVSVRRFDEARKAGRKQLRDSSDAREQMADRPTEKCHNVGPKSVTAPRQKR